jgi:hypothetical protein
MDWITSGWEIVAIVLGLVLLAFLVGGIILLKDSKGKPFPMILGLLCLVAFSYLFYSLFLWRYFQ